MIWKDYICTWNCSFFMQSEKTRCVRHWALTVFWKIQNKEKNQFCHLQQHRPRYRFFSMCHMQQFSLGGTFYLFIPKSFITYNIIGAKELMVLLWLSGDILYKQCTKRVGLPLTPNFVLKYLLIINDIFNFHWKCWKVLIGISNLELYYWQNVMLEI